MMPPARMLQLAAAATFVVTLYFFLVPSWGGPQHHWGPAVAVDPQEELALENEVFKELKLPPQFEYRRHCFTTKPNKNLKRESLVELPRALLSEPKQVVLGAETAAEAIPESVLPACHGTYTLEVPEWDSDAHLNTSELVLGVATTMKRIEDSLDPMSRWLSGTGSALVVLLVDQPKLNPVREDLDRIYALATSLDIQVIFEPYEGSFRGDSEGIKNFALAPALWKNRRSNTKWFSVIDDDTFFLSLPRVYEELQPYDPTKQWYIGALTEGHTRVSNEGWKAWGGAAIFFSAPLMALLSEHSRECKKLDKYYGDLLWRDCVMEVTSPTVHLTEMRGLNQMDLWGDISGWYEAPHVPLLTLHHWKSWHSFPVPNSHLVADAAGPDAFLQRYRMFNNTVLTNGFSIVTYPDGFPDLNLAELTFYEDVGKKTKPTKLEFHHSLGKMRPALEKGKEKISWGFRRAIKSADGTVRQFYVKGSGNDASVIELDWKRG